MARSKRVDMIRGVLILLVVIAHFEEDTLHDIIFMFHMPLFFVLTGFLLDRDKLMRKKYWMKKMVTFMIPYFSFMMLDLLFARRDYSFQTIIRLIWGGRALSGTYWYITCFLAALALFGFMLKRFSDKTILMLIMVCGCAAVVESNLSDRFEILKSPGFPWNLDVALLAVVYIAIGFYQKRIIRAILCERNKKYDVLTIIVFILLAELMILNFLNGGRRYYFDMKPIYYKELLSAVIVPCAFGVVLFRFVFWLSGCKKLTWLCNGIGYIGQMTLPIMFMHLPLNQMLKGLNYGRFWYVLIGVAIPIIFTLVLNRIQIMRKIFCLPVIVSY